MRALINYVIQTPTNHFHKSEMVQIDEPPYNFSNDPPVHAALEWKEKKSKELQSDQELVIVSIYKA